MTQTQQGLKSLREKFNLEVAEERCEFLNQCYPLINDWNGPLPNLRDIFRPEEVDSLLSESIKSMPIKEVKRFVDFVASTGYKDEPPKVDKDGHEPPSRTRTTPLHHAARQDSKNCYLNAICIGLFEVYNERRVNYTDEDGLSHFHVACEHGCDKAVAEFLELAGHDQVDPNRAVPETGDSPLHLLLGRNRKELAESLLRRGADPNAVNKAGNTPLHAMCNPDRGYNFGTAYHFFKIVDVLWLSVRLDARDERGNTPLHLALSNSCEETVLLLLSRGADLSLVNDDGVTPLHRICQRQGRVAGDLHNTLTDDEENFLDEICERFGHRDLHETLFSVCAEKNIEVQIDARDKLGNTPLHEAARRGNWRMVKWLMERGADANLAAADGSNPLYLTCFGIGRYDMMELLRFGEKIGYPVQVDTRDKSGNTLLHSALKTEMYSVHAMDPAVFLLRRGADPNATNEEGQTPVHLICQDRNIGFASSKKFFETVDEIEAAPPLQVNARDNEGRTPLQSAVANMLPVVVDELLNRGADFSSLVLAESWLDFKPPYKKIHYNVKWRSASAALAIVEHLENKGYELDRSDALTIMKLFAEYEMFERLGQLGERWYDDESFANDAKDTVILPKIYTGMYGEVNATTMTPRLSLYDLIRLPAEEVNQLFTYTAFYEFTEWNSWVLGMMKSASPHTDVCARHLCEKLSRRFFRPWALIAFSELTHYRLPELCCDMVIEHLRNEDLFNICLAAEGRSSAQA